MADGVNPLELLDDVLRVSNLGDVAMTPDYKGALIGFLARCRVLLNALRKMAESDTDDVGDLLTRSISEHVVTGRWMLLDPPTNFRWLFQDYVQHWVTMRNEHRPLFPGGSRVSPSSAAASILPQYVSLNVAPGSIGEPGPLQYLAPLTCTEACHTWS